MWSFPVVASRSQASVAWVLQPKPSCCQALKEDAQQILEKVLTIAQSDAIKSTNMVKRSSWFLLQSSSIRINKSLLKTVLKLKRKSESLMSFIVLFHVQNSHLQFWFSPQLDDTRLHPVSDFLPFKIALFLFLRFHNLKETRTSPVKKGKENEMNWMFNLIQEKSICTYCFTINFRSLPVAYEYV